ncbi:MAG: hypothetical protein V4481_04065 [Patescibacteria group bacterium]
MKIKCAVLCWLVFAVSVVAQTSPSLRITKTNQSVVLKWDSVSGVNYSVLQSFNLNLLTWNTVTNVTATSSTARITLPVDSAGMGFYRLSNELSPLRVEISLTNGTQLQGTASIGFTAVAQNANAVYATLRAWTNGGKTNTLAVMDLRERPTNSVELDTTRLVTKVPHYLQLEVADNFGNAYTGENARWALSQPVMVIPTNAISLIHKDVIGWNFAANLVSASTTGTWSCIASNAALSNYWSGTLGSTSPIRIRDTVTDFSHSYPGDTITVYLETVSGGVTTRLVRTIPVDRRPMIQESLVIGQVGYLTNSDGVNGELYALENRFLSDFQSLGSGHFRLASQSHSSYPSSWNSLSLNPSLWNTARQYLNGGFGPVADRMFVWSPGFTPLLGDTNYNLSVGFLEAMSPSNRMSFAALSGCNSTAVRSLVWPDQVERSELFEWGLNPRLGLSWKGYPFSQSSTTISQWERTFWNKFNSKWFQVDGLGLGMFTASEAIQDARTLEDGVTENPMFPYLVVVGTKELFCDEVFLTPYMDDL